MITSLCSLFLSVGVLQPLAWIHRSIQNKLEAGSGSGQLLSYPTAVSFSFSCGSYPEWSPQLKKDKRHVPIQANRVAELTSLHIVIKTMAAAIVMCVGLLVASWYS